MYTRKRHDPAWVAILGILLIVAISVIAGPSANAAYTTQVPLGAARSFAVLAGAAVTRNATTVINGDVGYGTAITLTTPTPAPAPAPAVLATSQTISTLSAVPFDVFLEPTVTLDVGSTGSQIPVAVVTSPRLPSTSTNDEFEPLNPVNFVQGFALGFALIGGLLLLGLRRSV